MTEIEMPKMLELETKREIEFRAKGLCKDIWYYGNFVECKRNLTYQIVNLDEDEMDFSHYVKKETVGQYTGFKDKNDKKIFEGDIVIAHYFFQNYDPITLGVFEDEDEITGEIIFDLDGFRVVDRIDECRQLPLSMIQEPVEELEVIGNIYDNPELIKKGENNYEN